MKINITDNQQDIPGKLSVRLSVFTWIICALLGWGIAYTSITGIVGENETFITQNEPSFEDASKMEQILPASGNQETNK